MGCSEIKKAYIKKSEAITRLSLQLWKIKFITDDYGKPKRPS